MTNKAIIILIIAVVLVGFLAAIFLMGNSGVDEFSIKSNDQLAELIIPKGTLPDGVNVDDISVTRISNNQVDDESLIVYELEPDGLEFTDEILLKVQLDSDNDTIPIVFTSTSTKIDLVNNTQSEVDLETKKQNVTIPLTHFSEVWISRKQDPYKIKVSAQDTPCGKQILTNASFTLYKDNYIITYISPGVTVWKFLEPSVKIKGSWEHIYLTEVSPIGVIHGKPYYTDVSVGQTVTFQDDTFKCIKLGPKKLWYVVEIHVNMKKIVYDSEEDYFAGRGNTLETKMYFRQTRILYAPFKCISEDVEEDPKIDPRVDPGSGPEVELSVKYNYNDENLLINQEIFVDIWDQPGATGLLTLSGGVSRTPTKSVIILDESGHTRDSFIVWDYGEYTVLVEIGEFSIEKKIWVGPE